MNNRMDEYRTTYKQMADGQLLELAAELDHLTGEAQTALWAEMGRRGITEEATKVQKSAVPADGSPAAHDLPAWGFFGADAPAALPPSEFVAVFSADSEPEAEQVQESLRAAGIESLLEFVVLVRQDKSEKAFGILSEQLGPDAESGDEMVEDEEEENRRN